MSKKKAILKYALGGMSLLGAIGTIGGTGTVHILAHAIGIKINPRVSMKIAEYQFRNAIKKFEEADAEWRNQNND